jgi:mannose-6-phosphate isomerase-like protein (cupin superfamily)
MYTVIADGEIPRSPSGTLTFEGEPHGSGVSGPGDIAVVGPDTPHMFKNIGTERLDIICIHASPRLIQESLA